MSAQKTPGAWVLAGAGALSILTLAAYWHFSDGATTPQLRSYPAPQSADTSVSTPASISRYRVATPAALALPPSKLSLGAYDLTPDTFTAWRDYLIGDPAGRLFERIAWRTTLWDAVVDASERDMPIMLEVHGGNALGRC